MFQTVLYGMIWVEIILGIFTYDRIIVRSCSEETKMSPAFFVQIKWSYSYLWSNWRTTEPQYASRGSEIYRSFEE